MTGHGRRISERKRNFSNVRPSESAIGRPFSRLKAKISGSSPRCLWWLDQNLSVKDINDKSRIALNYKQKVIIKVINKEQIQINYLKSNLIPGRQTESSLTWFFMISLTKKKRLFLTQRKSVGNSTYDSGASRLFFCHNHEERIRRLIWRKYWPDSKAEFKCYTIFLLVNPDPNYWDI